MSRRRTLSAALLSALVVLGVSRVAVAETEAPEVVFERATAALRAGEYNAAIDGYESLADRGFVHPDASYDRGLAYVMRVRQKADKPGDLGRAAAAFAEALRLRPDDQDGGVALDQVRAEVTRRRSRKGKDAVDVRPTIDRLVIGLASERGFAGAAFVASMLLAIGLFLRRTPSGPVHVAGSVMVPTSALALLALLPLTWASRDLRLRTQSGVVVATEVYMTADNGVALGGDPIPEAAEVEVRERKDARLLVRWGPTEGWVPLGAVQILRP